MLFMKANGKREVIILTLFAVCSACVLSGCRDGGTILVGQPEVFTRERLIDARYEDYEWLRGKLEDVNDAVGFQGLVDRKILDVAVAKIVGQYGMDLPSDSNSESSDAEGANSRKDQPDAKEVGGGSSVSSVKGSPMLSGQNALASREAPSGAQAAETTAQLTKIDQLNDQLAYRSAVRGAMRQSMVDDSHDLTGGMLYDLKFDLAMVPGDNAQRNAIVVFTIKSDKECGNFEDDEAKDCEDDGSKDREDDGSKDGKDDESKSCKESSSFDIKKSRMRLHEYAKWVTSVEEEINDLSLSLQQKLLRGTLSSTDTRWSALAAAAVDDAIEGARTLSAHIEQKGNKGRAAAAEKSVTEIQDKIDEKHTSARQAFFQIAKKVSGASGSGESTGTNGKLSDEGIKFLEDVADMISRGRLAEVSSAKVQQWKEDPNEADAVKQQQQTTVMLALAQGVVNFYEKGLTYYSESNEPKRPLLNFDKQKFVCHNTLWYVHVELSEDQMKSIEDVDKILSHLERRYGRQRALVVDTQPKEYAQNISDVGAGRYILNFLAAFSGKIGSNLQLGADYERFLDEQIMLQAILRRPLAIGFNNSCNQFGYILGPQFEINKSKKPVKPEAVFRHRAARYTVGATMIAAAWKRKVTLEYKTYWVDDKGRLKRSGGGAGDAPRGSGAIEVSLPWDYRALTRAVMFGSSLESMKPSLHDTAWSSKAKASESGPTYRLTAGAKGELLIRGMELWRNPQVFVGSQRADKVTVLANMDSLHARFKKVDWPGGSMAGPAQADLTVITSYGAAVLDNAVEILPADPETLKMPVLALDKRGWTLKQEQKDKAYVQIGFKVVQPLPKGYADVTLKMREAGTNDPFEFAESKVIIPKADELLFQIQVPDDSTKAMGKLLGSTKILEVQPVLRLTPKAELAPVTVIGRGKLAYFADEKDRKIRVLLRGDEGGIVNIKGDSVDPPSATLKLQNGVSWGLFELYAPEFVTAARRGDLRLVLRSRGRQYSIRCSKSEDDIITVDLQKNLENLNAAIGGKENDEGRGDVELTLSTGGKPELTVKKWTLKREKKQE